MEEYICDYYVDEWTRETQILMDSEYNYIQFPMWHESAQSHAIVDELQAHPLETFPLAILVVVKNHKNHLLHIIKLLI